MNAIKRYFASWLTRIGEFSQCRDTTLAVLVVCFLTLLTRFHSLGRMLLPDGYGRYYYPATYLSTGLLLLLVPLLTAPFLRPSERFGFRLGNARTWLIDIGIAYGLLVALIFIFGRNEDFLRTYPLFKPSPYTWTLFLLWETCQFAYMFGWEFIFRGYLLFTAKKEVGVVPAILLQMLPFAYMHIGKPELEIYGSIFAGLFLGMIAIRARSFIPGAILHFAVALTMDLFAIMHKGMLSY
jgi:membrane protease YdiL (CAAX protease family)